MQSCMETPSARSRVSPHPRSVPYRPRHNVGLGSDVILVAHSLFESRSLEHGSRDEEFNVVNAGRESFGARFAFAWRAMVFASGLVDPTPTKPSARSGIGHARLR